MDKEKEDARRLEIESNLQKLTERRNSLKDAGQLEGDIAVMLNRGIIINMLDLANIKNKGVVLNLLRIYNDTMNETDFIRYDKKELFDISKDSKKGFLVTASKNGDLSLEKFYIDDKGVKCIDNCCKVSKDKYSENIQLVFETSRNVGFKSKSENIQTYLIASGGFLLHEESDYNVQKNNSTLFDSMRVRESVLHSTGDIYNLCDILYYGNDRIGSDDLKYNITEDKVIRSNGRIEKYKKNFERVFPKTLKLFDSDIKQMINDHNLEKICFEDFLEVYNNIPLLEANITEEQQGGPTL